MKILKKCKNQHHLVCCTIESHLDDFLVVERLKGYIKNVSYTNYLQNLFSSTVFPMALEA